MKPNTTHSKSKTFHQGIKDMRRLSVLLLFSAIAVIATAGSSDSRVTKQMPTYQVDRYSYDYTFQAAVDAEIPAGVEVASPDLGQKTAVRVLGSEKSDKGHPQVARPPPDMGIKKS